MAVRAFRSYTTVSSGQEDDFIDNLDLSEDSIEKLKETIESISLKAYDRGYDEGKEEGLEEASDD